VVEDRLEKRGDFDIMVMKYLQAININEHINPGANALIGSLWRNLYWMSKDVSDTAFAAYCVKKAMEKLKIAIDGNEFHDAESKTTTALSLAAMMINNGERKEIKHYITIAAESPNERIRGRALQIMARMEQKKN
jgi:hypothetical protein